MSMVKTDAVEQARKAGVVADRIKEGMHFQELQDVGLLLISALKPDKRLVVVPERQIGINKSASRHIAFLPAFLQFVDQANRFLASSRARVRCRQQFDGTRAS